MQTWVVLKFANGEYLFRLGLEQIKEVERVAGRGIGAVYASILRGRYGLGADDIMPVDADYRFPEMVEVIRQGLIGGGSGTVDGQDVVVSPVRAGDLIDAYVTGRTGNVRAAMRETWALAAAILSALIEGYSPPKKEEPAASRPTRKKSSTSRGRSQTAP